MSHAVTIFVSAFLLFQVQPLMGRLVLPWFGGSAAVWTSCLLFFQVVLLLGYLYAHGLVRGLGPGNQARLHIALLLLSLGFLPLWPSAGWKPQGSEEPTVRILGLLAATVGLPYMLLASTSPLIQVWYVRQNPHGHPYRLFALSNLGSMLGLIGYVLLIEPRFTLGHQSTMWSVGYGLFVACAAYCALRSFPVAAPTTTVEAPKDGGSPSWRLQLLWLALAGCASLLLMSTTHYVSQNVAPVPFLWVGMLGVYLLSFILCFEGHNLYWRWLYYPLLAVALQQMASYLMEGKENFTVWTLIPVFLGALFVACMVCHGELARLRPAPRHLTTFYLMCALGGALGGLFTAVIAPRLLPGYFELHLGIVTCPLLLIVVWLRELAPPRRVLKIVAIGGVVAGTIYLTTFLAQQVASQLRGHVLMERNFYGVLTVTLYDEGKASERLSLTNGTILHGEQFTDPQRRRQATTYYGTSSGVGLAITASRGPEPQRVGVVGLGTGTLAGYGRPGDVYRFYEINPLSLAIARNPFTYLGDAPQRVQTVLGDARLNMEREAPQQYDVLAIDAFSSDAIPLHLLTLEAFGQYFRHLAPHGVLAVHVSNHYLDLAPVVRAAADSYRRRAMIIAGGEDASTGASSSSWILVGNDEEALKSESLKRGTAVPERPDLRAWTDDYANVLEILKKP